jgi:hypothetical protein
LLERGEFRQGQQRPQMRRVDASSRQHDRPHAAYCITEAQLDKLLAAPTESIRAVCGWLPALIRFHDDDGVMRSMACSHQAKPVSVTKRGGHSEYSRNNSVYSTTILNVKQYKGFRGDTSVSDVCS